MSNIEWTTETWNPIAGCDKISAGCKNCYAIKDAHRLAGNPNKKIAEKYQGTTKVESGVLNWTGKINFSESALLKPLSIKKPTTFFVNSMSDLFHENVKNEWIDRVFAVMALTPQHTYQILTKRPERMREYLRPDLYDTRVNIAAWLKGAAKNYLHETGQILHNFPLKNVWLGVSCENQKTADERIPLLLETPAAIRFLSCEPLLEEIDLTKYLSGGCSSCNYSGYIETDTPAGTVQCRCCVAHLRDETFANISWAIIGGESGNNARPCDISWIRSIVQQCKSAGTKVFVKQLGAGRNDYKNVRVQPVTTSADEARGVWAYSDKKGGDIDEFPSDLQIREMPN